MNRLNKILWTISIRSTKSENLLKNKEIHLEIAEAYQREYDRREKVFIKKVD